MSKNNLVQLRNEAATAYLEAASPARAMLDLITSTGGDTAFEAMDPKRQQAYLGMIFNCVHDAAEVLRHIGGCEP